MTELPGASRATGDLYDHFGLAMAALEAGRHGDAAMHFIDVVFMLQDGAANTEPAVWKAIWQENSLTLPACRSAPAGNIATCQKLGEPGMPALVVAGSLEHTYDPIMAEQFSECLPHAPLFTTEGAIHDGPYREPKAFAVKIHSLLDLVVDWHSSSHVNFFNCGLPLSAGVFRGTYSPLAMHRRRQPPTRRDAPTGVNNLCYSMSFPA